MIENLINNLGAFGLFLITFLSGSIIPFPSEAAIILASGFLNSFLVLIVSTLGGILGNITNYYIGKKGIRNWLVGRSPKLEKKSKKWFNKWGQIIILVAPWLPFVGDPAMIVAGALEINVKKFILYVSISRIIKNILLIYFGIAIFSMI